MKELDKYRRALRDLSWEELKVEIANRLANLNGCQSDDPADHKRLMSFALAAEKERQRRLPTASAAGGDGTAHHRGRDWFWPE